MSIKYIYILLLLFFHSHPRVVLPTCHNVYNIINIKYAPMSDNTYTLIYLLQEFIFWCKTYYSFGKYQQNRFFPTDYSSRFDSENILYYCCIEHAYYYYSSLVYNWRVVLSTFDWRIEPYVQLTTATRVVRVGKRTKK